MSITPEQCIAARELLGWTRGRLANAASVIDKLLLNVLLFRQGLAAIPAGCHSVAGAAYRIVHYQQAPTGQAPAFRWSAPSAGTTCESSR